MYLNTSVFINMYDTFLFILYKDEIRRQLCERGCANTVMDLIIHSSDRETIRRASMAFVNLALNCMPPVLSFRLSYRLSICLSFLSFVINFCLISVSNVLAIFKCGILQKLLAQLNDRKDKELTILAAKILVNLTTNGIRKEKR